MASNCTPNLSSSSTKRQMKAGQIFQEIYFLLGLRKGGIIRNGEKWIFKSADDLAQRFNLSERTVRRHISVLVNWAGLRQKHKAKSHRDLPHLRNWRATEFCQQLMIDETTGRIQRPLRHSAHGV